MSGSHTPVKLDNWEIGVLCDLEQQYVREYAQETEDEKEQRAFVEKEFSVPSDYQLQRLYAKLTCEYYNSAKLVVMIKADYDNSRTMEQIRCANLQVL